MTELALAQAERFAELDSLLSGPVTLPAGEPTGASLADGTQVRGTIYRAVHGTDSIESVWHNRVVWELNPLLGDTGDPGMHAVLAAFRHAVSASCHADPATSLTVTWPSRDVSVAPALYAHGFTPMTVLAVRTSAHGSTESHEGLARSPAEDFTVRHASMNDLEDVLDLQMTELRYSRAVVGGAPPDNARKLLSSALRRDLESESTVLLAESQGVAVGVACCAWTTPATSTSITHRLPDGRWGHVRTLAVAPGARGQGIGRSIMRAAHRELANSEITGTYLYYDIANPLSTVFWSRQGYRPLWTRWTTCPSS